MNRTPCAGPPDTSMPALARAKRHDEVAAPRVQHVLEPLDGAHRRAGHVGGLARCMDGADVGELVGVDELGCDTWRHRGEQAHRHTGEGGVGSRPRAARTRRRCRAARTPTAGAHRSAAAPPSRAPEHGRGEPAEGHAGGVEDRDHEDRAEVVDDRQRQQEDSQRGRRRVRRAAASTPTAKRDVGGHGDAPAARRPVPPGRWPGRAARARPCRRARPRPAARPAGGRGRSPSTSSRLISRPTTKKKIAIRPSLTQCCRSSISECPAT